MLTIEEYKAYIATENKSCLESTVTLAESENNHQEYFNRLLLRRMYLMDDFTEREKDVLLRLAGIVQPPENIRTIAIAFGVTREYVRLIVAKALHKMRFPTKARHFLRTFTTKRDFEKATELATAENPSIASMLQDYIRLFDVL